MRGFPFTSEVSVACLRSPVGGHRLCSDVVCAAGKSPKGQAGPGDLRAVREDSGSHLS
jgi:hypothetical protein